jgi:N-acetylglucosaminyldiphosphoundecaprenol N-acetyl-beta-D-mannosaminyltransferase
MRTEAVPDFSREVHCLLGLPFDAVDLAGAEARIRAAAASRSRCFLSTPNVNFLVGCRSDGAFRDSVVNSDLSVADGMPLVWLARLMGIPIRERVAGSTLFEVLRRTPARRLSVYFFGGADGVAEAAWRALDSEAGGLACVGYASPGFGSVEDMSSDSIIQAINASRADVLVVSLGARKGHAWIERNRARLEVPVISHLGAVLQFASGCVRRAPHWMQRTGLEWLWRIKEQPALWRRYFSDGLALLELFAMRVIPHAWYQRRNAPDGLQLAGAGLETREEHRRRLVRLRGAWTRANLARLRRCCHHAAFAGRDLRLDLGEVTYVDSAFVGLLMVVEAHQRRLGRRLILLPVAEPVRRVIRYCCAEYLLAAA